MQFHVTGKTCINILMPAFLVLVNGCSTQQVESTAPSNLSTSQATALFQKKPVTSKTDVATPKPLPTKDPEAMSALRRMGVYLRTLQTFRISSETTIDERLASGQKVMIDGSSELTVHQPNRLHLSRKVDEDSINQEFFFNGKTFTAFGDKNGFYASFDAPDTIRKLLDVAANRYGIDIPLSDLFRWGTDADAEAKILEASYIGSTEVNHIPCHHYAFRNADVDWQLWIEKGDKPLPRKFAITTTQEEGQPRFVSTMNWNLSPKIDNKLFTFVPPKGAHKIEFEIIESSN